MNVRNIIAAAVITTLTAGAVGAVAYAKEGHESAATEAAIMAKAKVSLVQAIAAAEKATGGKAVGSGIEGEDGGGHFEVTTLKDGAVQKVLVDTQTGNVVKTTASDNAREND